MSYYCIATREQKCRRYLHKIGLALRKSRIRDKWADTYGMYAIIDPKRDAAGYQYDLDLEDVEAFIRDVVWPELSARGCY